MSSSLLSAAGGEIFNQCVADSDEAFTEKDVIRLAKQILTGVAFLHRSNVVHLDLKVKTSVSNSFNFSLSFSEDRRPPAVCTNSSNLLRLQPQNILLTSARPLGDIRIVDFGLSRRMDKITEVREILGTPEYVGEWGPPPSPSGLPASRLTRALCFDSSAGDPELRTHQHGHRHVVSTLEAKNACARLLVWIKTDANRRRANAQPG